MLLVEFFATWCAACKNLEERTFTRPGVLKALQRFELLKIDTDLFPEAGRHYNVSALPTLLILDARGVEMDRMVGSIEASELAGRLSAVRTQSDGVQLQ
jgi:thiol:disulfide interchange protein DsbD